MRTTLDIDDDVLRAARNQARRERKSLGKVMSELALAGLAASAGLRPFPRRGGVITNELVDRLHASE